MPQKISSNIVRICKLCGQEFNPTARKQYCCNQQVERTCEYCGKPFLTICTTGNTKRTCSKECQSALIKKNREQSAQAVTKKCAWCGAEFKPKSVRQIYCDNVHYQDCAICGTKFAIDPRKDKTVKTCSDECRYKLVVASTDREESIKRQQQTMLDEYGVTNIMYVPGMVDRIKKTTQEHYGVEWYTQTDEYKKRNKAIAQQKYGVDHHLQSPEVISKREQTCNEKYGSSNIFSSEIGKQRVQQSMMSKYGVTNPSQYPEFKSKATRNARTSKLEQRVCNLLSNYSIEFMQHHIIRKDNHSHEFDFYLPQYKLLIDADGLYYHSYLDDPDGERVRDDYDEVRLFLVPPDHTFHVVVEGNEDKQIKEIVELIETCSGSLVDYDSILFKWCRSMDFPYPNYSSERLIKDWSNLCQYVNPKYSPQCRIGESIVKQFHKSIYDAKVRNCVSPVQGWYDDNKLRQVIRNRFIYQNNIDPSKILSGFNISKICPKVSVFNPIFARYLVMKYLPEFKEVFDPFSGFSGRLLGVASLHKQYTGQDLNPVAVSESNEIIKFLQLDSTRCRVSQKDILDSEGEHECLLTCPPYGDKEIYNSEVEFKLCDAWIDECLSRFRCNRYVFVVDSTDKYKDKIVETTSMPSHFARMKEKVVVIDVN